MDWQPIETAPRDGRFLVWLADEQVMTVGAYRAVDRDTPDERVVAWLPEFDVGAFWHIPTHWMPLPPPPTT